KLCTVLRINKSAFSYLSLCSTGEELSVSLRIQNNSPHDIKPKYSIYKKTSYFARKKRKCQTKVIVNEVGTPIPPSASENVTKVLTIPKDVKPSIHNCKIIKVEYRLKVSNPKQLDSCVMLKSKTSQIEQIDQTS
uniref:Arrestin C-terminal-like domain-containing protein n=2 Tax=Poecilia TaxID=8080 RepID=A0A3B3USH3_9TELE